MVILLYKEVKQFDKIKTYEMWEGDTLFLLIYLTSIGMYYRDYHLSNVYLIWHISES